jgi:chorismate-pyruvate lyase
MTNADQRYSYAFFKEMTAILNILRHNEVKVNLLSINIVTIKDINLLQTNTTLIKFRGLRNIILASRNPTMVFALALLH